MAGSLSLVTKLEGNGSIKDCSKIKELHSDICGVVDQVGQGGVQCLLDGILYCPVCADQVWGIDTHLFESRPVPVHMYGGEGGSTGDKYSVGGMQEDKIKTSETLSGPAETLNTWRWGGSLSGEALL